jgi:aryl-alcohol dehydrogenase-like predicted oxidoreductase
LDRSFELGCNSFDTARIYRDSERTLGAWIREHRNHDNVVIISKGCHPDGSGHPRQSMVIAVNPYGTNEWQQNYITFRAEERIAVGLARPKALNIVTGFPGAGS